ncbi:MAG: hypothetical protein DYH16_04895 [Nitrosomonas sp. PRO5]|nr:hypothetical protein [Nitrosomonas sp. PRO5]
MAECIWSERVMDIFIQTLSKPGKVQYFLQQQKVLYLQNWAGIAGSLKFVKLVRVSLPEKDGCINGNY